MELVVTLSNIDSLNELKKLGVKSIMCGGLGSSRFNFSLTELAQINYFCKQASMEIYLCVDAMISEDDKPSLIYYLEDIAKLDVDGIYFADFGFIEIARIYDLENKLIYDGGPIMSNSLDVNFLLSQVSGVVLARELRIEEIIEILKNNPHTVDMQIFGHTRLSTSKRMFLTNYFKQIEVDYSPKDRDTLLIEEEQRDYRFPIKEDEYGTHIYSDYVFECYQEFPYLNKLLKRGIIDDQFIDFELTKTVISDLNRNSEENSEFLDKTLRHNYPEYNFSTGYFYQEVKQEEE